MNLHIFKLVDVYESTIDENDWLKFLRVEILESTKTPLLLRARVWLSESYNLYPSAFNTDNAGKNTQMTHSVEILSRDITVILPFGGELIKGKIYQSKQEFTESLFPHIEEFLKSATRAGRNN